MGLRVLLVDDDEEDALILRDLLADTGEGHVLDWEPTLERGLAALASGRHEVCLVDYRLGPDNGLDLVRAAESSPPRRPVIVLTGRGNPDVDREALAAGAADYLVKGNITADLLSRALRYAVERARQRNELAESHERYRLMFEQNPMPAWVFDLADARLLAVNDAMVAAYGYPRDELLGMTLFDLREPVESARLRDFRSQPVPPTGYVGTWKHRRRDGTPLWVDIWVHGLTLDGREARIAIARDVSATRAAQARMQLLERAVESSASAIVITDALAPDNPLVFANAAFERITGYAAGEVMNRNCRFLQGGDVGQAELALVRHALATGGDCSVILRNYRKDGALFWNHLFLSPVRDEDGRIANYLGVINDLTERRHVEAELAYAASHDPVTGLPRYPVLESMLASLLSEPEGDAAVYFIDIDRFHAINESMGHVFGDEALHILAERLSAAVAGQGWLARFAGDEFVAVRPGRDEAAIRAFGEQLRAAVAEPIEGDGYRLQLTASIGVSRAPDHGRSAMDLLRRAEAAMSRAKRQGRDCLCEFASDQMQEMEDRLLLGARLREAPRRGELELHYQPLIDVGARRVLGFEALLRWSHPELGRVAPARFIPLAESLGLMGELGQWVIDEACRQLRAWDDAGHGGFTVAVNVSAQELQRHEIVDVVREAIARHGIAPARLEIEITESSLMEHVERVVAVMGELKQLGVSLSLDDFGTGYSSLAYLKQFSLDKIKIDRTFVRDLPDDADDAAIARTIVVIGHQLRLRVVAEGVETPEQEAFLRAMGCDQLQGYLFSPPVPAAQAIGLLKAPLRK